MKIQKRLMTVVVILFFLAALAVSPAGAQMACKELATLVLPDTTINVAELITSGTFTPPDGTPPITGLPAFCRVFLTVAPQINVEVWLPANGWNNRFQAVGGGGYAGRISWSALGTALRNGYATSSTDTGHTGNNGKFGLNPDRTLNWGLIEDFASRSLHEMTVKAKALIANFYDSPLQYSYWNGCSTGGRQGIMEAQRFPSDYDGILAGAPAINWDRFIPAMLWPELVMKQKVGHLILASKFDTVNNAALTACDGLDGLVDGLLDDPRRCDFDPQVLQSASCTSTDPTCLTPAEVTAIRKIWDGARGTNGDFLWYGLEPSTSFAGMTGTGIAYTLDHIGYWVERNPTFDWHALDYAGFEADFEKSHELFNNVIGTDNPDLCGFRDSGAKILIWHGWTDQRIYPQGTVNYYERVLDRMCGSKHVEKFARLFMAPGVAHCGSGTGPNVFDMFGSLVAWVEQGIVPDQIIASHLTAGVVDRTRPLCPYPKVARYLGTGSINDAANFTCVKTVQAHVRIKPETLKLGSNGPFTASITLPWGYDVRDWEIRSVVCEGAPAVKVTKKGHFFYMAKFNTQDLVNITPGEVPFTVTVILEHRGHHDYDCDHEYDEHQIAFEGSDTLKVK